MPILTHDFSNSDKGLFINSIYSWLKGHMNTAAVNNPKIKIEYSEGSTNSYVYPQYMVASTSTYKANIEKTTNYPNANYIRVRNGTTGTNIYMVLDASNSWNSATSKCEARVHYVNVVGGIVILKITSFTDLLIGCKNMPIVVEPEGQGGFASFFSEVWGKRGIAHCIDYANSYGVPSEQIAMVPATSVDAVSQNVYRVFGASLPTDSTFTIDGKGEFVVIRPGYITKVIE